MKHLALAAFLLSLGACSWLPMVGKESPPPASTLADLSPVVLPDAEQAIPELGLEELANVYRQVLEVSQDPELRLQVRRRLADIELLASEAEFNNADVAGTSFDDAINSYQDLLRDYPEGVDRDLLLYQLAKAHDLNGEGGKSLALMEQLSAEYPDSRHYPEAEFRKGEAYFSGGDYGAAEAAFSRVAEFGTETMYLTNALYMQGWSRFKQNRYEDSIGSFTATLDQLMRTDNRMDRMPRGEREVAADCFRVLAVSFSYLQGSETIAESYVGQQQRSYQHLLYEALAELYLKQQRYRDSAETYQGFIAQFPDSQASHSFQLRVIGVYEEGGFPQQVIQEKRQYVAAYGVSGSYWRLVSAQQRQEIRPRLQQFIPELAQYHHAAAQAGEGEAAQQDYLAAADYYQLYIDSFPRDDRVPEVGFLLAEARFASGDYRAAISDYEWMAYRYREHDKATEAGYAAILAHQKLGSDLEQDRDAYIDSQLKFSQVFSADPRAPVVLGHAASQLLELGDYHRAVYAATDLTEWQPYPGDETVKTAWLVKAHGQFELGQYSQAEQAYQSALALMPAADELRPDTVERVAASVYRQGEQAAAQGKYMLAAQHYSRVMELAPDSSIRMNAQFDAATSLVLARDLDQANRLLIDFRKRYPEALVSASISATLVENYEQLQQWEAAAGELDRVYAEAEDPAVRREALYIAAGYYAEAGSKETAIDRYRSYAHDWPEPVDVRMEAMNHLAQLYGESNELSKRYYWLAAMARTHDEAGQASNERSLYLAASSSSELADRDYQQFTAISLNHPIKQSLRQKREAMDRAVAAYEKVNAYGLQEFGTRATYRLGRIYQQLSLDLMASQRPRDLDALALEQYEMLLEEQAYPFEERAIDIYEANAKRSWDGLFDQWIDQSFVALADLLPARYGKVENGLEFSREIR